MFSVTRPKEQPKCTKQSGYNTDEIVSILHSVFHGKCYLCEKDNLHDPEIEHFSPHERDEQLKYTWSNLYYACGRCNNIKSNKHVNLLDCAEDPAVFRKIKHFFPSGRNLPALIVASNPDDEKTANTAKLLDACFNLQNTPQRKLTRIALYEEMCKNYLLWLTYREIIVTKSSSETEVNDAKGKLKSMLKVDFPFSVFWRWHTIEDDLLLKKVQDLVDF